MTQTYYSPLGQSYCADTDPGRLYPIARQAKREKIGIREKLPFMGVDIWNAYELSWLNLRGKPQIALATFIFPADSPNLIESKSLKLYLNNYNQMRLEIKDLIKRLTEDLSQTAEAPISVQLTHPDDFKSQKLGILPGYCIDNLEIEIDDYTPDPSILRCEMPTLAHETTAPIEETLTSNLFKSNCPVTGQPDWASVQIHYVGQAIDRASLLRYLVSFRNQSEFHEQCIERIFMDILSQCHPMKLAIYGRYTRRGGIDINPWRTNFNLPLPPNLRTPRQ